MTTYTAHLSAPSQGFRNVTLAHEDTVTPTDPSIGSFTDLDNDLDSKVIYHYVRDLLYKQGITDMAHIKIMVAELAPVEPEEE